MGTVTNHPKRGRSRAAIRHLRRSERKHLGDPRPRHDLTCRIRVRMKIFAFVCFSCFIVACDPCDNSIDACQACCEKTEPSPVQRIILGPEVSRGRVSPFTVCECVEPASPVRSAVRFAKFKRRKAIRPSEQDARTEAYIQRGCYSSLDACQTCCDDWISNPSEARIVGRWDAEENNRPKEMCLCNVDPKK